MIQRPWPSSGLSWLIAVIVVVLALISLVTTVTIPHLDIWLIIGLAVAILV